MFLENKLKGNAAETIKIELDAYIACLWSGVHLENRVASVNWVLFYNLSFLNINK